MSQWETLLAQHCFANHEMGYEFRKPYSTTHSSFHLKVKFDNLELDSNSYCL